MSEPNMKPIWYFVGLMLTVMGTIIFLTGVYQLFVPPTAKTILGESRPGVWWGAFMAFSGMIMYWKTKKQQE